MRLLVAVAALLLAGCLGAPPSPGPGPSPPHGPFEATSAAFAHGQPIPMDHTCIGHNVSPPIEVRGAPAAATHLALVMYDPDAPLSTAPTLNVTHWLVWDANLTAGAASFPRDGVPPGAVEGSAGDQQGYRGPCPPVPGDPHRYFFHFYVVGEPLGLAPGSDRAALEGALQGRALAEVELMGTFTRPLGPV